MPDTAITHLCTGVRNLLACLGSVSGQVVTVVSDSGSHPELVDEIARALSVAGATVKRNIVPPAPGTDCEPPDELAAALREGDAVVEVTTVSIRHSRARQLAQQAGVRYLYLGNPDLSLFDGKGAIFADFPSQRALVQTCSSRVDHGQVMRLTSEAGTDLTIDLDGRRGRALTGMADQPGMFGTPPCLEWGVVPALDGANGILVVDAWGVGIGLLSEQVHVTVRDGRAVEITGGSDAARLRDLLASANTPNAYQVCEIGGMNPDALMIDDMMSAEAVLGTAHIAVGTTPADPGVDRVDAGMHIDLVFWRPTITIDGETIMSEGNLVITAD